MKTSDSLIIIEINGRQTSLIERPLNRKQTRRNGNYIYRPTERLSFKWKPYENLPENIVIENLKGIPKVTPGQDLMIWLFSEGEKKPFRFQLELITSGIRRLCDEYFVVRFDPTMTRIKATHEKLPMVFLFEYSDNILTLMNIKFSVK